MRHLPVDQPDAILTGTGAGTAHRQDWICPTRFIRAPRPSALITALPPPLLLFPAVPGATKTEAEGPLSGGHGDEPLRGLIVRGACRAPIALHPREARFRQEVRQFRPSIEPDTAGDALRLCAAYPNPRVLTPAPALSHNALLQQVLVPLGMPVPGAGLERAGPRLLANHLQQYLPSRRERAVELPQNLAIRRDILEGAERAQEAQRQVTGRWSVEVPHVLRHDLPRQALAYRRSPCGGQVSCGAVGARDPEATAGKLQGVAARSAAQIEHGGALRGRDEDENLLGFAHGHLAGANLGGENALQPLPERVLFKPSPHAHVSVK